MRLMQVISAILDRITPDGTVGPKTFAFAAVVLFVLSLAVLDHELT